MSSMSCARITALHPAWTQVSLRRHSWPLLLSGLTVVWVFGAVLLVIGYFRTRRKQRITLERWAIEEAPLHESIESVQPPAVVPKPLVETRRTRVTRDSGIPTIEHDGQDHTLH